MAPPTATVVTSTLVNKIAQRGSDDEPELDPETNGISISTTMSAYSLDAVIDRALSSSLHQHDHVGEDAEVSRLLSQLLGRPVLPAQVRARRELLERELRPRVLALLQNPGVTQRTPEWYAARMTMITASDIAQALGCAKFGTQKQFFVKKCGGPEEQKEFDGSLPPLKWGVMFEPVANAVYERLNGVCLHEFGLLRHPEVDYIGASPDGITDDGVMVEIKCPWRRKITGEVPLQYYYQIQGQLEVTGLRDCDYFECEFFEVPGADEADAKAQQIPWARGVFLELVYQARDGGKPRSEYRYPPREVEGSAALAQWAREATLVECMAMESPLPVQESQLLVQESPPPVQESQLLVQESPLPVQESPPPVQESQLLVQESPLPVQESPLPVQESPLLVQEHWWVLATHCTVRVAKDPEFLRRVLSALAPIWDRVQRYRADRALYEAEVLRATPEVARSQPAAPDQTPTPKRRARQPKATRPDAQPLLDVQPSTMSAYAFVSDEE
jgi:putative phage-type endonuclease